MSKRILVFSGSPRKDGNSETLCDQFIRGACEAGNEAEKIILRGKDINYCTGCGHCFRGDGCSQDDDMMDILKKMIAADVIVMATPVYFYTMNGQMKTLIDRTCARYREIAGKELYFIMTAADRKQDMLERTVEEFRGFTLCLPGAQEKGIIYGTGVWEEGDVLETTHMNAAYSMGRTV